MWYGHPGYGDWGFWGLLGPLLMLLFWVGLAFVVASLARGWFGLRPHAAPPPAEPARPEDRALTILRERYARGEINSAEYEERRQTLLRDDPFARDL
jgi:putative membrane protein